MPFLPVIPASVPGSAYTELITFFKAFKLNEFAKVSKAFAFSIHVVGYASLILALLALAASCT